MENAADHISYQLPIGCTNVQIFADSIEEFKDSKICAAISNALDPRMNMCTDFESAVGFVLPHDPVLKKRGKKRGAIVSYMTGKPKPGTGRTGVALLWHKYPEFNKPIDVRKDELGSWQEENIITGPPCGNSKGPNKKKGNYNKESTSYNKKSLKKYVKKAVADATKESITMNIYVLFY